MDVRVTNPVVRWLILAGILVVTGLLGLAAARHELAEHWAGSANPDNWLRAAEEEPTNPENWYRLGRYRELDLEHADLPLAISYYRRAVAIDPASPYDWTDLANTYDTSGDLVQAERSFRAA